jgi:hypothetical protein
MSLCKPRHIKSGRLLRVQQTGCPACCLLERHRALTTPLTAVIASPVHNVAAETPVPMTSKCLQLFTCTLNRCPLAI